MRRKILVVDDDEFIRRLISATLGDDNRFELILASNGEEALELAAREKPELILLDVLMPKINGFEVCRRLKSNPQTASIRVILLTALGGKADQLQGKEAGADGYFTKPFSPLSLIQTIEKELEKR